MRTIRFASLFVAVPCLALGGLGLLMFTGIMCIAETGGRGECFNVAMYVMAAAMMGLPSGVSAWTGWRATRFALGRPTQWRVAPLPPFARSDWNGGLSPIARGLDLPAAFRWSAIYASLLVIVAVARHLL